MSDAPGPPLGVIETDAFCDGCGFNLHGQRVWRDARVRVYVCRCPECGTLQSADGRAGGQSPWAARAGVAAASAWIGVALAFVLLVLAGLFFIDGEAIGSLTYRRFVDREHRPLRIESRNLETGEFANCFVREDGTVASLKRVRRRTLLQPWLGGPAIDPLETAYRRDPLPILGCGVVVALPTLIAATILSCGTWFWPAKRRWAWLTLPLIAAVAAGAARLRTVEWQDEDRMFHVDGRTVLAIASEPVGVYLVLIGVLALQVATFAGGIAGGHAIARGVLGVIVPPGLRRSFAFLWPAPSGARGNARIVE